MVVFLASFVGGRRFGAIGWWQSGLEDVSVVIIPDFMPSCSDQTAHVADQSAPNHIHPIKLPRRRPQ